MKTKIAKIDAVVHSERINSAREKVTFEMDISEIPDGTFILTHAKPYLFFQSKLHERTPNGDKVAIPPSALYKTHCAYSTLICKCFSRRVHTCN